MEHKGYYAKIEYDANDNTFFGTIEGIPDSISFEGTNTIALRQAFIDAVEDYLEMCKRLKKEPQKHYKGSFNVRVSPEVHKKAAILALSNGMSLNQFIEIAIRNSVESN